MLPLYNVRLAVSPINWINDDMTDLGDEYAVETVLSDMQRLGFTGTEMGRKYSRNPEKLKPLLAKYGLVLSGAWKTVQFSSGYQYERDFAEAQAHIQFLRRMGASYVVICDGGGSLHWDARGQRHTVEPYDDAAWARLAAGLHRLGEYANRQHMHLVYHAHVGTCVEKPGAIDHLMAITDPELVSLLADTGHIYAGGGNPAEVIRKHQKRIHCIHLKDVRPDVLRRFRDTNMSFIDGVRAGIFTTPGDGCVDFARVFAALHDAGYQGWMVLEAEQDPKLAEPVQYARAAKAFLAPLIGQAE